MMKHYLSMIKKPYSRLKKSGIELIIKNIVNRTNGIKFFGLMDIFLIV